MTYLGTPEPRLGGTSNIDGIGQRVECPKAVDLIVHSDPGLPPTATRGFDTSTPALVVSSDLPVADVCGVSTDSQIRSSVIKSIAVNVVHDQTVGFSHQPSMQFNDPAASLSGPIDPLLKVDPAPLNDGRPFSACADALVILFVNYYRVAAIGLANIFNCLHKLNLSIGR